MRNLLRELWKKYPLQKWGYVVMGAVGFAYLSDFCVGVYGIAAHRHPGWERWVYFVAAPVGILFVVLIWVRGDPKLSTLHNTSQSFKAWLVGEGRPMLTMVPLSLATVVRVILSFF